MKKYIVIFAFMLVTAFSFAQNNERNSVERNSYVKVFSRTDSHTFLHQKPKAKGTLYLFERWNNVALIETIDGNKAIARNINYNVDSQVFESQLSKDSIRQFNFDVIRLITINNKQFKKFDVKGKNKMLEVIFESQNFSLLKAYLINVFQGSYNPMVNRKSDMYTKRENYYLKKGNSFKEINLNKKNVFKILKKESISEASIRAFVKENKLTFKNDFHVQLIMKHFVKE